MKLWLPIGLRFVMHAEGYFNITSTPTLFLGDYVYNFTDHLGNIRMSYAYDRKKEELKILEENHYYPFGLRHTRYNNTSRDFRPDDDIRTTIEQVSKKEEPYNYKYQGQEWQDELGLNWDSFKYRNYDYAIGRFMSIDPLTEKYDTWSPYAFSGNRVVDSRELEGLEPHSMHASLKDAGKNFGSQYNGLSIRMNGEIATKFYATNVNGQTMYSYVQPAGCVGCGMISLDYVNDPIPEGGTMVGDGHTHHADNNDIMRDDNGKIIYDGMNNFSEPDMDGADTRSAENPNYEGSILITPNGKGLIYTPDGSKGDDRKADVKRFSDTMPSDPNSVTRQHKNNPVSPNTLPQVLHYGVSQEEVDKLPLLPEGPQR